MSLPLAILAGGLATRLGAMTEQLPKSLVEVGGRPFVEHQFELLRRHGFEDIVMLVGHFGQMLYETIGDGRRHGLRLTYSFDSPQPLGTGGAVRRALPALGPAFFVMYGDSYLECDYRAIERAFLSSDKSGLMTVYRNDNRFDCSNVVYADGNILHYNKHLRTPDMSYIDYGLGAFRRTAFELWPDNEPFDLAAVYQRLLTMGDLAGFEVAERFYEIGSHAGLEATRAHLAARGMSR
jgi:N-acetyl-alpha-D-muramate 1-phosphate uridylyltransferase